VRRSLAALSCTIGIAKRRSILCWLFATQREACSICYLSVQHACLVPSVNMSLCFKIALASLLTSVGLASNFKYTTAGYSGSADWYDDSQNNCPIYGNSFSAFASSAQSKFKATPGKTGYKETTSYDELYVSFSTSTCDGSVASYKYGNIYDGSFSGGALSAKLTIETKKLLEGSLLNVPVPVYGGRCTYGMFFRLGIYCYVPFCTQHLLIQS
jgi:hypothetical protein